MDDMNPSHRFLSRGAGALLGAALLGTSLMGQVEPTPTPNPTPVPTLGTTAPNSGGPISHHDRGFLKKAAKGGMKEVAVSQAVAANLTNAQVKQFAQQMIADHTAANAELASLAASKGVDLPPQDPDLVSTWSKKTDNVDREYVNEMLSDHEDAVKLFTKGSESKDPDIAAFAQKTLPILEHHLQMVQDLNKAIK
jgi:putative membrane protein